jgi:hypothetical protein
VEVTTTELSRVVGAAVAEAVKLGVHSEAARVKEG